MIRKTVLIFLIIIFIAVTTSGTEIPGIYHRAEAPEGLRVMDLAGLSGDDQHLATIIQGMANRERARIYCVNGQATGRGPEVWLPFYEKEYGIRNTGSITLDAAFAEFAVLFKGYAVFSPAEIWTVNVADTYCAVHDCLPVTPEQESRAAAAGLEKVEDFRGRWDGAIDATIWSYNELFPLCSKKGVASMIPDRYPLRDYLYANRIFTFFLAARGTQLAALKSLMRRLPENIPVFGYIAANEVEELLSEVALAETSKYLVASGFVSNMTVHSSIPVRPLPEIDQWTPPPEIAGKLGVVIALSDGDNVSNQTSFQLRDRLWMHPDRGEVPVAWSLAPQLYELAPGVIRYYYVNRTPNDYFVVMNGAGYTHPSKYADADYFGKITVDYMRLTGLDILWTLDPGLYFSRQRETISKILDPFMGDGLLKGVLVAYTPTGGDRYGHAEPGYPPLLYCKVDYLRTKPEDLAGLIETEAAEVPPDGKIVFLGLNIWEFKYEHIVAASRALKGRDDIVFLSPQQAMTLLAD